MTNPQNKDYFTVIQNVQALTQRFISFFPITSKDYALRHFKIELQSLKNAQFSYLHGFLWIWNFKSLILGLNTEEQIMSRAKKILLFIFLCIVPLLYYAVFRPLIYECIFFAEKNVGHCSMMKISYYILLFLSLDYYSYH